jgi:effector-binding domain-containing protein
MKYEFEIVNVQPVTLAVVEAQTKQSEVPSRMAGMFDIVYAWLRESGLDQIGNNYALYDRFTPQGMRMQIGLPVSKPFTNGEQVKCVELPGGRAAHVTHTGPYGGIPGAFEQLNAWCAWQPLALAGASWEVYGDWQKDESKLVTDIYFRLK